MLSAEERFQLSVQATEEMATGDAYGNHHGRNQRKRQAECWKYTDDTLMALSILENLRLYGEINQDVLAQSFAERFDGNRGYGQGVTRLLKRIQKGGHWRDLSYGMFDGKGSYGNGAAMHVAPVGAYFADDLQHVVEQATRSADVTHANVEGIAGAVAVGIAVAKTYQYRLNEQTPDFSELPETVIEHTPESDMRAKIATALKRGMDATPHQIADELGNGRPSIAQLTVPFALWSASKFMADYETAIRKTASVQGDVDTNCAIVGGIVVMATGMKGIPAGWLNRREKLMDWAVGHWEITK